MVQREPQQPLAAPATPWVSHLRSTPWEARGFCWRELQASAPVARYSTDSEERPSPSRTPSCRKEETRHAFSSAARQNGGISSPCYCGAGMVLRRCRWCDWCSAPPAPLRPWSRFESVSKDGLVVALAPLFKGSGNGLCEHLRGAFVLQPGNRAKLVGSISTDHRKGFRSVERSFDLRGNHQIQGACLEPPPLGVRQHTRRPVQDNESGHGVTGRASDDCAAVELKQGLRTGRGIQFATGSRLRVGLCGQWVGSRRCSHSRGTFEASAPVFGRRTEDPPSQTRLCTARQASSAKVSRPRAVSIRGDAGFPTSIHPTSVSDGARNSAHLSEESLRATRCRGP